MKIRGQWDGCRYNYNNGVQSKYRIEIKEIISYQVNGESRYRIEYYDGEVDDISDKYFSDGSFISEMVKLGKYKEHKSSNGKFIVYSGYEYDYLRELASK